MQRLIDVGQCGLGLWHWLMLDSNGRVHHEETDFGRCEEAVANAVSYARAFNIDARIVVEQ